MVEMVLFTVALLGITCILAYFYFDRRRLQQDLAKSRAELRNLIILEDTQELPGEQPAIKWERFTSPLPPVSTTLEHRLIRQSRGHDHYPFILPGLEPVSQMNKATEMPRIAKVMMRANDWIETRDQFGFQMDEYSGLWDNVGEAIRENFNGEWIVPRGKTGYHNIIRFKKVRPQDFAPGIHPRDLPEAPNPNLQRPPRELSPLL